MPGILGNTGFPPPSLQDAINAALATTGLKSSLDVGLSASYAPNGANPQKWLDLSGNADDFFLGATGSVQTDDPVFNGAAGGLSLNEYWGFAGAQFFRLAQANPAWVNSLHKSGSIFSLMWIWFAQSTAVSGDNNILAGDFGSLSLSSVGIGFQGDTAARPKIIVSNGSGLALNVQADTSQNPSAWNMVAVTVNDPAGAGGSFHYLNGGYNQVSGSNTFNGALTSPSAAAADFTLELMARGDGVGTITTGARLGCFAAWQGTAVTKAQFDIIWSVLRGRFGL